MEKKILIIIPAYNEEENIEKTVRNILKLKNNMIDYIVINDGSRDKTVDILKKNKFSYISLPINLGIGGAVQTGYKYALENNYDIAIQFDGDGQHNAEYIEEMSKHILEDEQDFVIGSRFLKNDGEFKSTILRRTGKNFLMHLIKFCTGQKITDPTSGFRACNKEIIKIFANDYPTDYPEPDTIVKLIKSKKFKITEIPVAMNSRSGGESSINGLKPVYYMIKVSLSIIIASILKEDI